uniref:Uncharacterized protein n=1 Tax=Siphoviridae sp. ctOXk3 TaxID=2827861 RepID=A0A8S5SY69_9CAUD|nr:MAG TPA: hypothetical protein [Siphoviridae sp. ctOXk3]
MTTSRKRRLLSLSAISKRSLAISKRSLVLSISSITLCRVSFLFLSIP